MRQVRHYDPHDKHRSFFKGRAERRGISHFGHRNSRSRWKRPVAMKMIGEADAFGAEILEMSDDAARDLIKYLRRAAEVIVKYQRGRAASFSRRIPISLSVKSDDHSVYVEGGGPKAPNAYPFDPPSNPPVYHPLYGNRKKWYAQPYRPFLEEGAEMGGDEAADKFADIINEWAKEIGTDRPSMG